FAISQTRDGSGIPGIACQVVPAEPFHSENPASSKNPGRLANAVFTSPGGFIAVRSKPRVKMRVKIVAWTASWTGQGLGVETTVARVRIFRGAVVIERPIFHGGVPPVVRQSQHDGVTRATVGAVDIRIPITRIGRVEEFL